MQLKYPVRAGFSRRPLRTAYSGSTPEELKAPPHGFNASRPANGTLLWQEATGRSAAGAQCSSVDIEIKKSTPASSFRDGVAKGLAVGAAVCVLLLAALAGPVPAGDWPTYRHDIARSGITSEKLATPLALQWTFQPPFPPQPAWGDPKPEPVEGYLELRRMHFDDVFHTVSSGGAVYFGSSSDHKLYCLDAKTGQIRWTALTGGPIRLAPTIANGRVYVGSDDGSVYCFQASNGKLVWKRELAPKPRRVLGSGKLISPWPVRTGVLIDGSVAYVGAGIFPAEGLFLYALDADTGEPLWCNDTCGEEPQSRISFQGYLLASPTTLYVPMARVSPAAFDRSNGRLKYLTYFGKAVGGTFALLAGDDVFTGTEEMVGYRGPTRDRFAVFSGRQLVVTDSTAYVADGTTLSALDRRRFPAATQKLNSLRAQRADVAAAMRSKSTPELQAKAAQLDKDLRQAEADLAAATLWKVPCTSYQALILAGDTLVVGGTQQVTAVDAAAGKTLWKANVEGTAKGLTVADGRLLVSTDSGSIYCFGATRVARPTQIEVEPATSSGDAQSAALASQVLEAAGVQRGYCLVAGLTDGQLPVQLARQSELMVYATDADPAKVAAARAAADRAGLLGGRVCVEQWPADAIPYANYFANLIVSETALAGGSWPVDPQRLMRMLKPAGGVMIGPGLSQGSGVPKTEWRKIVRGLLPGSDDWTHQYANPGNTASSNDQRVKCPLRVLWFGRPGPGPMVNRHQRAAAPLCYQGRLFIQGENRVMAYDAYNGVKLWERQIAGARRVDVSHQGSNLAVGPDGLLVAVGKRCLRLDLATGADLATYELPEAGSGRARWGYLARCDGRVFGSRTANGSNADLLFALDAESGRLLWSRPGKQIPHASISIDGGRLFYVDRLPSDELRRKAIDEQGHRLDQLAGPQRQEAEARLSQADVRLVVALDAGSGKPVWQQAVDVTHCGGGKSGYHNTVSTMAHDGVLVLFGVYLDGHYWRQFFAGEFAVRRVIALGAEDGRFLWSQPAGYRVRPVIIGNVLHTEPWAFDLNSGKRIERVNPITGRREPWQFARPGHHCGCPAGCPNALFFRSLVLGYYDLLGDYGTMHFGGQRPGCWINFLPAAGLLLMPEASAGCMCAFPNMCTVVFEPAEKQKGFAYYSTAGDVLPVARLGINFAAAGDRLDSRGKLWLGFPRYGGSLVLRLPLQVAFYPGGGYLKRNSDYTVIDNTDDPWLFAGGIRGLRRVVIPLLRPGDGTALYKVRLGLADPDQAEPGHRVFDVKLQGRLVRKGVDIAELSGGRNRAMWLEFTDVEVSDQLTVELVAGKPRPASSEAPVLQAIGVVRQKVLHAGCTVPAMELSSLSPERSGKLRVCNLKDAPFEGSLELVVPDGFRVSPQKVPVVLPSGQEREISVEVSVDPELAAGMYRLSARLIRADGTLEIESSAPLEHLGRRGRVILHPVADSYVSHRYPTQNKGTASVLLVDGGDRKMGDRDHAMAYLRFRLDVPGTPVKAVFRIHNAGNPSGDGGRVCLVDAPWEEDQITYENRPKPGRELVRLGRVSERQTLQFPLPVDLRGKKQLDLVIDPTSCDGVDYLSRQSEQPPELIVDYVPEQ